MENPRFKETICSIKKSVCIGVVLSCIISNIAIATDDKYFSKDMKKSDPEMVKEFFESWELLRQSHLDPQALDKALSLLRPYLQSHSEDPVLLWKWSEFMFYKGESIKDKKQRLAIYWEALDHARKSLDKSPSLEAHFWAGCIAARLAEMEKGFTAIKLVNEALKRLEQVSQMDPQHYLSAPADTILAAIYIKAPWPVKDLDTAKDYLLKSYDKDPNLTMTCEKLSAYYLVTKDYEKAETEAKKCLAIENPTFVWDSVLYNWPKVRKILAKAQAEKR